MSTTANVGGVANLRLIFPDDLTESIPDVLQAMGEGQKALFGNSLHEYIAQVVSCLICFPCMLAAKWSNDKSIAPYFNEVISNSLHPLPNTDPMHADGQS